MMNATRMLIVIGLLLTLLFPLSAAAQPSEFSLSSYGAEQLTKCFTLTAEEAEFALGEAVDPIPTLDENYGYCTYASVAANSVPASDDLLPTYGPKGEHQYLAVTVWPAGNATDPWMYLAFAILDRDQKKLNEFTNSHGMTDLEALVNAESSRPGITREYLPNAGDGGIWYWQETSSGDHLAGIYALSGEQRVAVQALVTAEHTAEEMQAALISTVLKVIERNAPPSRLLRIAPVFADSCPNFSPYDAAAILQEPVNADAPVANLVFGPLSLEYEEALRGMCGYTNSLTATADSGNQTQLVTDLPYAHAVATAHFTGEILYSTNGTMQMDWMELIALAEVVAADNPKNDGKIFDYFYGTFNVGDFASWTDALEKLAEGSASFQATRIELAADDPRDELLWLWQTLDDGYFSLLVSRQGDDFDIVAALLGNQVNEKTVLGYSRVVLEKIADQSGAGTQSGALCELFSAAKASAIVGETLKGTTVQNSQGSGCKYTPASDRTKTQATDFSPLFQTFGILAGTVPPKAAQTLLSGFVEELSTNGIVRDGEALGALLESIQAQDFTTALQQLGDLEWNANSWQVEKVSELGDSAVLIYGKSGNGWSQFYLLQSREDGSVDYLTGVLSNEIADVRQPIIEAAQLLGQNVANSQSKPKLPTTTQIDCAPLSLEAAETILGESLRMQRAEGERGAGCKFTPQSEDDGTSSADFSPNFLTQGLLAGIMTDEGAKTTLLELEEMAGTNDRRLARAISRNDIAGALSRISTLAPESDEWKIEALPEVGESAIWVHAESDGSLFSIFLNAKGKDQTQMIAVQISLEGDIEGMREAVVAALAQN